MEGCCPPPAQVSVRVGEWYTPYQIVKYLLPCCCPRNASLSCFSTRSGRLMSTPDNAPVRMILVNVTDKRAESRPCPVTSIKYNARLSPSNQCSTKFPLAESRGENRRRSNDQT